MIKVKLNFESGKKFYESDYKDIDACRQASEKDALKKFRKKYHNAIIYDVFSNSDYDYIAGYIPVGDHYTSWVRGYFYLPSKTDYRRIIKMGKIKLT